MRRVAVEKPLFHQSDEDSGNGILVEPIFLGEGKSSTCAILPYVLQKNDGFINCSRFLLFLLHWNPLLRIEISASKRL